MLKVYLLKVILIECKLLNRSLTFFTVSLTFHKISESYDGLNHSWIFSKIVAKLTNIFGEHESSIEHYPTSFVRRKHSIQNDAKIFFFKLFANIFVRTKSMRVVPDYHVGDITALSQLTLTQHYLVRNQGPLLKFPMRGWQELMGSEE